MIGFPFLDVNITLLNLKKINTLSIHSIIIQMTLFNVLFSYDLHMESLFKSPFKCCSNIGSRSQFMTLLEVRIAKHWFPRLPCSPGCCGTSCGQSNASGSPMGATLSPSCPAAGPQLPADEAEGDGGMPRAEEQEQRPGPEAAGVADWHSTCHLQEIFPRGGLMSERFQFHRNHGVIALSRAPCWLEGKYKA